MTADLAARAIRYGPWICAALLMTAAVTWHINRLDHIEVRIGGDE